MKISTQEFRTFSSIINRAKSKDSGRRANLYIDPDEGLCSCIGDGFNFRFNFQIIEENNDELKPFRVDIERLLAVCNLTDEISIDSNYMFYAGKDKFNLYIEENASDSGFTFDYDNEDVQKVSFKENDVNSIIKSLKFIGEEGQSGYNMDSFMINNDLISSSNGYSLYQNALDTSIDFFLALKASIGFLIRDLASVDFSEIDIYYSESKNGISIQDPNKSFEIVADPYYNTYLPNDKKLEELENAINRGPNLEFIINRSRLKEIIDFLGVFVGNSSNQEIIMTCENDSLLIEGIDTGDLSSAHRYLESDFIISMPDEEGYQFSFSRKSILPALSNVFTEDNIVIQIGYNKEGKDYILRMTGGDGSTKEMILAILLKE